MAFKLERAQSTHERAPSAGNVIIELALSLPILLLLLSGIIDLALGFREHAYLVEASKIGARVAAQTITVGGAAATPNSITDTAVNAARAFMSGRNFNPANYRYTVRNRRLCNSLNGSNNCAGFGANAIQVAISRTNRRLFAFMATPLIDFPSCAASTFVTESNLLPVSTNGAGSDPCFNRTSIGAS